MKIDNARILKRYRFEKNLSRQELAKQLNVADMTIYRWEKNLIQPDEENQKKINILSTEHKEVHDKFFDILKDLNKIKKDLENLYDKIYLYEIWRDEK